MGKRRDEDNQLQVLPPEQVFLFEHYPEQPRLLERIKEFNHTGKQLVNDPERCRDVIEAILNGASLRAVARQFHVGRETLTAAFRLLEESGRLRPFKERLAAEWLETVQLTQWRIQEALVNGEMPLQVLPALAGIGTDKVLLLTHSLPAETAQKTIELSPEAVAQAVRDARSTDAESVGDLRKSLYDRRDDGSDTRFDTAAVGAAPGPKAAEAGGGDRFSAAGPDGRGDGAEKF